MKGAVFDVQHYAVHDGPGIRTMVYFKGCPLRCPWCANPESHLPGPEIFHRFVRCKSCLRCAAACPENAVAADPMNGGPAFDRGVCRTCLARPCVGVCWADALRTIGRLADTDEILRDIMADQAFYRNSGGGVTFSGGEPFSQPEFLTELLVACRGRGVHSAVETCGHAPWAAVEAALPWTDLFLYDIKVMDPDRHRELTGIDNRLLTDNLRRLCARAADRVVIRVPLIPGYTDGEANVAAIASLAVELGVTRVDIMPYHVFGLDKYRGLGREYALKGAPALVPEDRVSLAATVFASRGLSCEVA